MYVAPYASSTSPPLASKMLKTKVRCTSGLVHTTASLALSKRIEFLRLQNRQTCVMRQCLKGLEALPAWPCRKYLRRCRCWTHSSTVKPLWQHRALLFVSCSLPFFLSVLLPALKAFRIQELPFDVPRKSSSPAPATCIEKLLAAD
jgi:hypothetical protein